MLYEGKGDVLDPNSYHSIALLDLCFKLYERILYHRLRGWPSFHEKILAAQFGFRANSGTLDAGFTFYVSMCKYVFGLGSHLYAGLINFRKAFLSVNCAELIAKLGRRGVSAKFLNAICVMFYENLFTLRADDRVTEAFPVITGLREGGVLSRLLFSLFISDIVEHVLCLFSACDFSRHLSRDPELAGCAIPGLLYADDLIILALNEHSLRIHLRRLAMYAHDNDLSVNVEKSEVVIFGKRASDTRFKFDGEFLPVRTSCRYIGIWFDCNASMCLLKKEILAKFQAAVPTFFSLCRHLCMSRLDHVSKLSTSLLFSVLYGAEFLDDPRVAVQLETQFFQGVRKFYGLPSGVSNLAIRFLFADVSLLSLIVCRKAAVLLCVLRPSDTYFPLAVVFDRELLFYQRSCGFSFSYSQWLSFARVPRLLYSVHKQEIRRGLQEYSDSELEMAWGTFALQPSSIFVVEVFRSHTSYVAFFQTLSCRSSFAVRLLLLIFNGALSRSYALHSCCPSCRLQKFTARHFFVSASW